MLRRVVFGLALAGIAVLAMLFTALNPQRFAIDIAFFKFEVTAGLALLVTFASGLLAGAVAASRWVAALLAERGRLRQALRLAETRLGATASLPVATDTTTQPSASDAR
jgi:hypothetical protein